MNSVALNINSSPANLTINPVTPTPTPTSTYSCERCSTAYSYCYAQWTDTSSDCSNPNNVTYTVDCSCLPAPNSSCPGGNNSSCFATPTPTPTPEITWVISEPTTWISGKAIVVTGSILVESDASLAVEPGVTVRFDGPYYLQAWEYDSRRNKHWHPGHGHWHDGPAPSAEGRK